MRNTFIDANGDTQDFEAAAALMDDTIRENLHADIAPCSPQKFIEEYSKIHEEKYGEEFAPYSGGAW